MKHVSGRDDPRGPPAFYWAT
eukprot:COSAG02_NODE_26185_length_638_cov_2.645640_1_plen_20_part_10